MEQSLFIEYIKKYFPGIVVKVVETLNDTKNPLTYLHKRMLRKDFSVTGKWESINTANTLVAADVVAMDSSLPLKKRDALSKANGDIPKMGMEMKLNEKQLSDLDVLVAQRASDTQLMAKLFADTPKVIGGISERNEAMFLEGLSTGVTLVEDSENVGTGVRLDYGYLAANKFGVTTVWSNTAATPLDDFQRVIDKAKLDGNNITRVQMDSTTFNYMVATTQMKQYFAFTIGYVGSNLFSPDLSQINTALGKRFGFTIELVDRSVRTEKNGVQTASKPWGVGMIVFTCSDIVGSLTWAKLAEQNHPVEGVSYETADEFILVSKYRINKPSLSEVTSSQARVVPVITNVDQIYTMDRATVQS